jgi:hypothetical protein
MVVCLVGADPEPVDVVVTPPGHSAIASTHFSGPNLAFARESEGGVEGILFEQMELLIGERANLVR